MKELSRIARSIKSMTIYMVSISFKNLQKEQKVLV